MITVQEQIVMSMAPSGPQNPTKLYFYMQQFEAYTLIIPTVFAETAMESTNLPVANFTKNVQPKM